MSGNQNSGRRPKPTALHLIAGNPSKKHLNDAEPHPSPLSPDRPDWLTPLAVQIWDQTVEELRAMGTLAHSDEAAIASYCQLYARYQQAEQVIETLGPYYEQIFVDGAGVEHKKIVAHPSVKVAKDSQAAMRAYITLLGLDPSSRSRLKVQGKDGANGESVLNVG